MTKKFFSLMSGESVVQAPNSKIIPGSEISSLQSAMEIIEKVKRDAEVYKEQVILETEILKEEAMREGFEEGFTQWTDKIARLEEEFSRVYKELEKKIIPLALRTARKIVSKEIELSPSTIVNIVSSDLKGVSQHKNITIFVNKKDLDWLESARPQLKKILEGAESLVIRERTDVEQGGCVIETEVGIINANIENKWKILETAFEGITKTKLSDDEPL